MDIAHSIRNLVPLHRLSDRVRSLQERFVKKSGRKHKRKIVALLLLSVSIALGIASYRQAAEEALKVWERAHQPTARVWNSALGSRGYRSVSETGLRQKILRGVPSNMDAGGSIWVSEEVNWIVVFKEDTTQAVPEDLYCLDCKKFPKTWAPMGLGWSHFDETLAKADEAISRKPMAKPRIKTLPSDPREIRY